MCRYVLHTELNTAAVWVPGLQLDHLHLLTLMSVTLVQGTIATRGDGLYEGLDWLSNTLKDLQRQGVATSVRVA